MSGSTISTTISQEVVLGNGVYLNPLTVSSAGRIAAPAPTTSFQTAAAIYASLGNASVTNHGVISGAIPATDTYTAPAIFAESALSLTNFGTITGQSGVYLQNGGTVTNSGSIAGLESAAHGGYGVRLINAELRNSGTVYGKSFGVVNWNASEVINSGSIGGETAGVRLISASVATGGTLLNSGEITGGGSGVTEASALITNSGTITGQTYGIRIAWGGSVTNTGEISAAVDGVLLLNQQYQAKYATNFSNSGTLQGGYFAAAINFANLTNTAAGLISGTTFGAGVGVSGYLYNSGTVYGVDGGLLIESGGRAVNAGTLRSNQTGIWQFYNSILTNASAGYVYSRNTAALDQAAYLVNAGTLLGNAYGVKIFSGGIVINSGTIASPGEGVYLSGVSATSSPDFLNNTGLIYGRSVGVVLKNGTAYSAGTIDSAQIAVSLVSGTSFNNSGDVYGARYGVQLASGTLLNAGSIGGKVNGVQASHGYIGNSGTIGGVKYAIYGTSFALTVDPGAVFQGNVVDKSKTSVLALGGSTPGTLSGIGTQFNAFDTISFEPGAHWLISGTTAGLAASQVINGFELGDTLVLTGFSATSGTFSAAHGGLTLVNGTVSKVLDITGSFTTANFSIASSGTTTSITLQPNAPCFVAGTRILTPHGETAVENLQAGDMVITLHGEDRPVVWTGHRTIDLRQHPHPEQAQPICIAAGALEENVPLRDLWVSPDHALLIDAVLIPAQLLLNDLNIYRGARDRVQYYHLELSAHGVIFAEHAPAETYLETGNRSAFEHAAGSPVLHPDFSAMIRQEKSCAALLQPGKQLDEIRLRITRRHHRKKAAAF
jgi:hypothetical protein